MLPQNKKLILFGSVKITDKRKGVEYLIESCKMLAEKHPEWKDSLEIVAFGNQSQQLQALLPFRVHSLPYIKNEHELVNIYNSVDIFAIPSLEENLPNMIYGSDGMWSTVRRLQVGGIPEMIDHLHNGYVAQYKSSGRFCQRHSLDIDRTGVQRTLRTSPPQGIGQLFGEYRCQKIYGYL